MQLIISHTNDIYSNLATEEYLLKNRDDDFFMLWQSGASVVVGKHQNAMAEINHSFLREQGIPVARRLSGGGTVYHGPGNVNFTYIINGQAGKLVDFRRFVSPIVAYLKTLGVQAEIGTRNDLLIDGLKISGNAEHVFKNRVLHHGTLLFNADLEQLNTSIQIIKGKYADKAVQSNRSEVTNISNYLSADIGIDKFIQGLYEYMKTFFGDVHYPGLNANELADIQSLRNEKYATSEWIYAYSPPFEVSTEFQKCKLTCKVVKGVVEEVQAYTLDETLVAELKTRLIGVCYLYDEVETAIKGSNTIDADELLGVLFG